jgi:hypothetical protein
MYRENTAGGIRHADHVAPSIRTSWQSLRRQAAVARSVYFAHGLRPWSLVLVGLERGPPSLVSTTEELLGRKVVAPVYKAENMAVGVRHTDHVAPSIRKSWH